MQKRILEALTKCFHLSSKTKNKFQFLENLDFHFQNFWIFNFLQEVKTLYPEVKFITSLVLHEKFYLLRS